MTFTPVSLNGFLIGLFIFTLASLLAAPLLSDCGRPTILRTDSCPDDIVHTGFPFIFFEEGDLSFEESLISAAYRWIYLSGLLLQPCAV